MNTVTVKTVTIKTEAIAQPLLAALRRDTGLDEMAFAAKPAPLGGGFWATS